MQKTGEDYRDLRNNSTGNLEELTGAVGGIVVYEDTKEAVVCRWARLEGMPRVIGDAVVGLGEVPPMVDTFSASASAVAARLDGVRIIYDETDLDTDPGNPGRSWIWRLRSDEPSVDVTVIVPEAWDGE